MKKQCFKLLFVVVVLLLSNLSHAQDTLVQTGFGNSGECGTEPAGPVKRYSSNRLNLAKTANNDTKYVFNVKVHFIANIIPEVEQELKSLDLVGALNLYFNSANIFFKYQGYDNIDDSSYLALLGSNIDGLSQYMSSNNVDIFIANTVNGNSAGVTWTWTSNTTGKITRRVIALRKDYLPVFNSVKPTLSDFKNYTSIHEMGHYLGLYHPHQRWKYNTTGKLEAVSDNASDCSALEENLDNSQWNVLGDFIQDTNPDRVKNQYKFGYYTNCTLFWGNYQNNSCGNSINKSAFDPSMDNIMAYYHSCRVNFSPNQYDFMRAFIEDESNGGFLTNQLNTIESLSKPYYSDIIGDVNSVHSTSDDPNIPGNVIVCRNPIYINKFQKGFDYKFYNFRSYDYVNPPVKPSLDVEYSVNQNPIIQNKYKHAVRINQVHKGTKDIVVYSYLGGYRGFICNSEPATSGKIISTSTLGGYKFNIKNLNKQEVTNPYLEQELEKRKYHIIQKTTKSGVTSQKTIYKQY